MDPPMGGTFSNDRSLFIPLGYKVGFLGVVHICRLLNKLNHKRLWPF